MSHYLLLKNKFKTVGATKEQSVKSMAHVNGVCLCLFRPEFLYLGEQMSPHDSQLIEGRHGVLVPRDGNFPSL